MKRPKSRVSQGFDFMAPFYDWLVGLVFGKNVRNAQITLLENISTNKSILLLGGGTGWIVEEILIKCKPKQLVSLDISAEMLALTKQRIHKLNQVASDVELIQGEVFDLAAGQSFDYILTPFFLDLFEPVRCSQVMHKVGTHLNPEGKWLVADFHLATPRPPVWQRALLKAMYLYFRLCCGISGKTLPPFPTIFHEMSFNKTQENFFFHGFIQTSIWERNPTDEQP